MGVRATMLELAILGELDQPLHGYELRQRLSVALGPVRRLSFGSLYPALHRLSAAGLINEIDATQTTLIAERTPRKQVIYELTDAGQDHLAANLQDAAIDDDSLGLTMRLMSKASPATRLALLKRRRIAVLERREGAAQAAQQDSTDSWVRSRATLDAQQANNELDWLDSQIAKLSSTTKTKKIKKETT